MADGLGPGSPASELLAPVDERPPDPALDALFGEIRAFYARPDVPAVFRVAALDPGYAAELWAATRRAFEDQRLSRRLKEALAFAVSLTSRSGFGTAFHLGEMRRLGVGQPGVLEVLIDLLARNERMEASQYLRQHLNTARITKLGAES